MSPTEKKGIKIAAQNRKAFHDYFVEDRYEAGIELAGTEVKSIRAGTLNLKDAYCTVKDGELFVHGMHISPYEKGNIFNRDPVRSRRLLMNKREIRKLHALVKQDGYALVPLSVYFKDSRVKLEIGLCRGKKNYDKRAAASQRDAKREIDRTLKKGIDDMSDVKNPIVTITMENGAVMTGELYPAKAPNTVANFISLANKGFYDGLVFHRVIPGFMIQGGCPDGNGMGGPGYDIRGEFSGNGFAQNDLKHTTGVLSMARAMHPDSAGSQFFIMVAPAPHLDGQYAAFGQVTGNVEEAIRISEVPTDWNDKPKTPVVIQSIRVDTQGVDYPEPEKR